MNETSQQIKIRFEKLSLAEAGRRAKELREQILDASADVKVTIEKDDPTTQDLGSTIVLVLGAPAVVAVAIGIKNYLQRVGGTITVEPDGKVTVRNVRGDDVVRIIEAIFQHK